MILGTINEEMTIMPNKDRWWTYEKSYKQNGFNIIVFFLYRVVTFEIKSKIRKVDCRNMPIV
jgi:hypothetical protein